MFWGLVLLALSTRGSVAPDEVRVRLLRQEPVVRLSGYHLKVNDRGLGSDLLSRLRKIQVRREGGDWLVFDETHNKVILRVDSKDFHLRGEKLRAKGRRVPGSLKFYSAGDGKMDVVSHLSMNEYLEGVIPSEMPALWPLEALKAQAVVSRSYTYFVMEKGRREHFDLEANVHDQVFQFEHQAHSILKGRERIQQALAETEGEVLVDTRGEVIRTYYHADCGGETEEPDEVWSTGEKIGRVRDSACPLSPHGQWEASFKKESLGRKIGGHLVASRELKGIRVASRTESGRVKELDLAFSEGSGERMTSQMFRRLLGFNKVKSTKFFVEWREGLDELLVYGQGHGHGVGLCQWGAKSLAERDLGYKAILKHYFPRSALEEAGFGLKKVRQQPP